MEGRGERVRMEGREGEGGGKESTCTHLLLERLVPPPVPPLSYNRSSQFLIFPIHQLLVYSVGH